MKKTRIGQVSLGAIPRVVAVIDEYVPLSRIRGLRKMGVDILEIRADLIGGGVPQMCAYVDRIKKTVGLPCIATVRQTPENRDRRLDVFRALMPFADAVDIEIDASINRQVIAHALGKTVIVSEHDFKKTPDVEHLRAMVDKAETLGADIVKIATMAKNQHDVARLMTFASACTGNIVAFAMGEYGTISRVLAPVFGSLFTYGYVTRRMAPGQLSVETLIRELRLYFPSLDKKCGGRG
jgi:3-dehydroquinate dehydratase I